MGETNKVLTDGRRRLALGLAMCGVVAVVLAAMIHLWTGRGSTAPATAAPTASPTSAGPRYAIDPDTLRLTTADVGPRFSIVVDGPLWPTQHSLFPLPYQKQLVGGRLRLFMTNAALSPLGRAEIEDWQQAHGFAPTDPPSIFGPFVADHSGIFELTDAVLSYATVDAARQDYHCCTYPNLEANWDDFKTIPIQLGDEADAWSGIRVSPTHPPLEYEEQTYRIRWRNGPVVTTLWVLGAHDITFADALRWATVCDQRIAQALQVPSKCS